MLGRGIKINIIFLIFGSFPQSYFAIELFIKVLNALAILTVLLLLVAILISDNLKYPPGAISLLLFMVLKYMHFIPGFDQP